MTLATALVLASLSAAAQAPEAEEPSPPGEALGPAPDAAPAATAEPAPAPSPGTTDAATRAPAAEAGTGGARPSRPHDAPAAGDVATSLRRLITGVTPKALLQLRLDGGDLLRSRSGRRYDLAQDLYLRRVRLGASAQGPWGLRIHATLDADHAGEAGRSAAVKLKDGAVEWATSGGGLLLRGGKDKLPYTRIGLTSSTAQLFAERPQFIEFARDLFQDFTPLNFLAHARVLGGMLDVYASVADGWSPDQKLRASGAGSTVRSSLPLGVARVELAPPGWIERERSDAHLGEGRHLQVGLSFAAQPHIAYADVDARETRTYLGADVSFHAGGFTAQIEGGEARIRSSLASRGDVRSRGLYAQVGYYLAALRLEPALRLEGWDQDVHRRGARADAVTAGLNAYFLGHGLKASANWVHRWLGPAADGRPADAPRQDLVELLLQVRI